MPLPGLKPEDPPGWYLYSGPSQYHPISLMPAKIHLRDTKNLKARAIDRIDKIGSFDFKRRNGKRRRDEESAERVDKLLKL